MGGKGEGVGNRMGEESRRNGLGNRRVGSDDDKP